MTDDAPPIPDDAGTPEESARAVIHHVNVLLKRSQERAVADSERVSAALAAQLKATEELVAATQQLVAMSDRANESAAENIRAHEALHAFHCALLANTRDPALLRILREQVEKGDQILKNKKRKQH